MHFLNIIFLAIIHHLKGKYTQKMLLHIWVGLPHRNHYQKRPLIQIPVNNSESHLKRPNLASSKNQRVPLDLWRCLHCPFNINIHSPAVTGAEHRHMLRQTPYFASPVVQYYPILSIATPSYQPYIEHSRSSRGSLWFLDPPNLGHSRHYSDLLLEL